MKRITPIPTARFLTQDTHHETNVVTLRPRINDGRKPRAAGANAECLAMKPIAQMPLVGTPSATSLHQFAAARTPAWRSYPTSPTLTKLDCRRFSYSQWFRLFTPKETPRDIVGKLNAAGEVLADPLSTSNSDLLRRGCDHGAVGQDYACLNRSPK